jgi:hypothetical protein
MYPDNKLIRKVDPNRQIESFHPIVATLKKKISGSIDGEAIQKDITGPKGTPPISNDVITGITPHEQNGEKAPTTVAMKIATSGLFVNALLINCEAPENLTYTDSGMVINK